ncbi:MAG: hypothetical protein V2A54_14030 [Bacteroidota bacterium]
MVKYGNECWWCQLDIASTSEHKYKKSDFLKLFGSERGDQIIFNDILTKDVQGPNSDLLKFHKNLCPDCNNSRSSKMDKAYSNFFEFMIDNYESIITSGVVDFKNIFGTKWITQKKNVMRYFLKHICCRLHKNCISIPSNYLKFLNGYDIMNEVSLRFCFNKDQLIAFKEGHPYLGVDPLLTNVNEDITINYIGSSYNFGPFKVHYLCSQGFHKGQHYAYEEYQNQSSICIYESDNDKNLFKHMTKQEYFQNELERIKSNTQE